MLTRTTSATSAVLSRRTSSLTLRVRGQTSSRQHKLGYPSVQPRLPVEITEAIFAFVLLSCPCPESKFSIIHPFTQASKSFREIALRLYFRDIVIDSRALFVKVWDHLSTENNVFRYGSDSFSWVRTLCGPSHIVAGRSIRNLGSFVNLHALEICFASEGLKTQGSVVKQMLDSFANSPARNTLKKLALTDIPSIDTKLLSELAASFSKLKVLELSSTRRIDFDCCLICLDDTLAHTRHSPIPDYCSNADKLADSFARSLVPMTKLEELYLGLYLSDTDVLAEHVNHSDEIRGGRGVLSLFPSCETCGKFREETQRRERQVSLAFLKAFPNLMTVRWDTLYPPSTSQNPESDEAGFYFPSEDELSAFRVPFTVAFVGHRHANSGEVEGLSCQPLKLW
ncbi:hypothetical protein AN958_08317 [Leucoagaricus sp. SymC.cos]|nr:hypothetical protein AN958_08317 [Leucoagaricus sp. SymC.cos]